MFNKAMCPHPISNVRFRKNWAFTLIELSLALVIIGLVVGGVLVGRDLITASSIRSQISQIEKYQVAVNTFKIKYGYLPGDIPDPTASGFGFKARGTGQPEGNGNNLIEGASVVAWSNSCGIFLSAGEPLMFWVDLSTANLIDGNFNTAVFASVPNLVGSALDSYVPKAKISDTNYVHVFNGSCKGYPAVKMDNFKNYFTIVAFTEFNPAGLGGHTYGGTGLSVLQAYNIDIKADDGMPQTGKIQARYPTHSNGLGAQAVLWAGTTTTDTFLPYTTATAASSTTCFDNGNSTGTVQKYSIGTNGGNGINCALIFDFSN